MAFEKVLTPDPGAEVSTEESASSLLASFLQVLGFVLYIGLFLTVAAYWLTTELPDDVKIQYGSLFGLFAGSEFWIYLAGLGGLTFGFTLFMQYVYPTRGRYIRNGLTVFVFVALALAFGLFTNYLLGATGLDQWSPHFQTTSHHWAPLLEQLNIGLPWAMQAVYYSGGLILAYLLSPLVVKAIYQADNSCTRMDQLSLEVSDTNRGKRQSRIKSYHSKVYSPQAPGYYLPMVSLLFTLGFLFAVSPLLGLLLLPYLDNLPEIIATVAAIVKDIGTSRKNHQHHLAMVGTMLFGAWMFMVVSKHVYFFMGLMIGEMRKNLGFGAALSASWSRLFTCTVKIISSSFVDLISLASVPLYYGVWYLIRFLTAVGIDSVTGSKLELAKKIKSGAWDTLVLILHAISVGIVLNTVQLSWLCLGMHTPEFMTPYRVDQLAAGKSYSAFLGLGTMMLAVLLVLSLIELLAAFNTSNPISYATNGSSTFTPGVGYLSNLISRLVATLKSNSSTSKIIRTGVFFILAAMPSVYQLLLAQRSMANEVAHSIRREQLPVAARKAFEAEVRQVVEANKAKEVESQPAAKSYYQPDHQRQPRQSYWGAKQSLVSDASESKPEADENSDSYEVVQVVRKRRVKSSNGQVMAKSEHRAARYYG